MSLVSACRYVDSGHDALSTLNVILQEMFALVVKHYFPLFPPLPDDLLWCIDVFLQPIRCLHHDILWASTLQ